MAFDAVISNMDSVRTYRELVGGTPARAFAKTGQREPACSERVGSLCLGHGNCRFDHR